MLFNEVWTGPIANALLSPFVGVFCALRTVTKYVFIKNILQHYHKIVKNKMISAPDHVKTCDGY